jgi:hypothetical protein
VLLGASVTIAPACLGRIREASNGIPVADVSLEVGGQGEGARNGACRTPLKLVVPVT